MAPLNSAPPPPEFVATTGGAGDEQPVMEREGGDVAMPDVIVPPPPPTGGTQDEQPAAPPVPPAGDVVVTDLIPEVRTPARRHMEKAASAPRPQAVGTASSSAPDTEVTSATPVGWIHGGGTGALNQASLDVQAKLRAEGEALRRCNEAYLESRTAIHVSCPWLSSSNNLFLLLLWGRASAPTGCSPQVSGRLLSRRSGTLTCKH